MQYDTVTSIQADWTTAVPRMHGRESGEGVMLWIPLDVELILNGYKVCLSLHLSPETMWFWGGNGSFYEKGGEARTDKERRGEARRGEARRLQDRSREDWDMNAKERICSLALRSIRLTSGHQEHTYTVHTYISYNYLTTSVSLELEIPTSH